MLTADLRYCLVCEGAPAYPIPYLNEDDEFWITWLCSSSGCMVGEDEPAVDTTISDVL